MSREKQIEEMAKITKVHCELDNQCGSCHWETCNDCFAEILYNAGYRKQSVGEWGLVVDYGESKKVECSICEKQFFFMKKGQLNIDRMPYCPNCGAKMKGDVK